MARKKEPKIETYYECIEIVDYTLSNILEYIHKSFPELTVDAGEIALRVRDAVLLKVCYQYKQYEIYYEMGVADLLKLKYYTEKQVVRYTRLEFTKQLIPLIIEKDPSAEWDVRPIIKYFAEDIIVAGLDIPLIEHYSRNNIDNVIELFYQRAYFEEITTVEVDYVMKLIEKESKTKDEFVTYLLSYYYYLLQYREIPIDLIENIGYYVSELESMYWNHILSHSPIWLTILIIYQALIKAIQYIIAYCVYTGYDEGLETLFNMAYVDKFHLDNLWKLVEEKAISEENYVDFVILEIHKSNIVKSITNYKVALELVKRAKKDVLEILPKRIRASIEDRIGSFKRDVIMFYSLAYDIILFEINAMQYLHRKVSLYLLTKEAVVKAYEETLELLEQVEKTLEKQLSSLLKREIKSKRIEKIKEAKKTIPKYEFKRIYLFPTVEQTLTTLQRSLELHINSLMFGSEYYSA